LTYPWFLAGSLAICEPNRCGTLHNDLRTEKGKYIGRIAQHSYVSSDILPG